MITVYSKDDCPQCSTAISLLKAKGLEYEVKKLDTDFTADELSNIIAPAILRSFPQIVKSENEYIGTLPDLIKYLKSL